MRFYQWFEAEGEKLSWREPTGHRRGPLANTQKKVEKWYWIRMSWMSVLAKKNENTPKNAKNNLLKTKRISNIKMWAKGYPVFTFSLPRGRIPPCSRQLRHWIPPSRKVASRRNATIKPVLYLIHTDGQSFGSSAVSVFRNFRQKWSYYFYWRLPQRICC